MKSKALKPYESLTKKISEIIERALTRPSHPSGMLPSLSELDIYREASASVAEIQGLVRELPQRPQADSAGENM